MTETTQQQGQQQGESQGADERPELADTPKLRKKIAAAGKRILQLRADRKDLNADIQSELESCAADGIPKDALKRALEDCERDAAERAEFDRAYDFARRALGKPVQPDLFAPGSAATH